MYEYAGMNIVDAKVRNGVLYFLIRSGDSLHAFQAHLTDITLGMDYHPFCQPQFSGDAKFRTAHQRAEIFGEDDSYASGQISAPAPALEYHK